MATSLFKTNKMKNKKEELSLSDSIFLVIMSIIVIIIIAINVL